MVAVRTFVRELPVSFIVSLFIGLAVSAIAYLFLYDAQGVSQGAKDVTHLVIVFVALGSTCMVLEYQSKDHGYWSKEHGHFHLFDGAPSGPSNVEIGLALGLTPVTVPLMALFCFMMLRLAWIIGLGILGF